MATTTLNVHDVARARAASALSQAFHAAPIPRGLIVAEAAVGWLETCYSAGWALTKSDPSRDPHNMGAIQCGSGWHGASFSGTDTHPNSDGSSTPYPAAFRAYPHPVDAGGRREDGGWNDLVYVMYAPFDGGSNRRSVKEAAAISDWWGVSEALFETGYYEGFGATKFERIWHHFKALSRAIVIADKATGGVSRHIRYQPPRDFAMPTLHIGDSGAAVTVMQWELDCAADGKFGPVTRAALAHYQGLNELSPDGVCGPLTWAKLLNDDFIPDRVVA